MKKTFATWLASLRAERKTYKLLAPLDYLSSTISFEGIDERQGTAITCIYSPLTRALNLILSRSFSTCSCRDLVHGEDISTLGMWADPLAPGLVQNAMLLTPADRAHSRGQGFTVGRSV